MEDQPQENLPDFDISRAIFILQAPQDVVEPTERASTFEKLLSTITSGSQSENYKVFCSKTNTPIDADIAKKLDDSNAAELASLEAEIARNQEGFGDVEVKNALLNKASFFIRIGRKQEAIDTLEAAYKKTVGAGMKIDNLLTQARIGFFFSDTKLVRACIEKAEVELEKGGDWERKNRLHVYRGVLHLTIREFKTAAEYFIKTLATFTSTELLSFKEFVFYTVLTSMMAMDRTTVKTKVLNSPEVLSVIHEVIGLPEFLSSLYDSKYKDFFEAFLPVIKEISRDRFLASHQRYFTRKLRCNAYKQFLTSYKSVTLETMAHSFGVSVEFIESEICSFVAAGQLSCKIDAVAGVIESKVQDDKNDYYFRIIKQGDLMLNKLQRLSKVIDM